MNSVDLASSELQRTSGALLCPRGGREVFSSCESLISQFKKTYYYRLTLSHSPSL